MLDTTTILPLTQKKILLPSDAAETELVMPMRDAPALPTAGMIAELAALQVFLLLFIFLLKKNMFLYIF
jgi:hypothetical protein